METRPFKVTLTNDVVSFEQSSPEADIVVCFYRFLNNCIKRVSTSVMLCTRTDVNDTS